MRTRLIALASLCLVPVAAHAADAGNAAAATAAQPIPPMVTTGAEPAPTPAPKSAPAAAAGSGSLWETSTTLRTSIGWRENVTVSAVRSLNRAFARAEADLFALRPIGNHAEVISFLEADVLRYFSPPPGVPGDQQWAAHLEGRWEPTHWFRVSLKGIGFIQDTFIDPSQTEGSLQAPLWVRVRGGFSTLTPRFTLPGGFAVEPSFQAKRITYRGYAGDYNETRPGVRLLWKHTDRLELSVAWYDHRRHYSKLLQSSVGGRPLQNRRLALHQRETVATATTNFSGHGRWTVTATAARLENRDRAYGYLDYNENRGELDVRWEQAQWRVSLTGEARRQTYRVQTVGVGTAPTPRITDDTYATLRVARDLNAKWTVFAEDQWERNRSNVADFTGFHPFSYRTNTLLAGVQRNF